MMRERCDILLTLGNKGIERQMCSVLTRLSHHNVVGNSSSMFVPGCALVNRLVLVGFCSADVHHQGA